MDATYHGTPSARVQGFSYPLEQDINGNLKVVTTGASGYAEGTTIGTATANVVLFRGTGGTLTVVGSSNGLPVTEATLLAGEDLTNNVLKVEQRFSYANIAGTAGTVTVKSGAGFLHTLVINTPVASDTITLYDSVGTSATTIGQIVLPSTLLLEGPDPAVYDVSFSTGLTIAHGSTSNITASYR